MTQPEPVEVICSYSHKDEELRNELANHLSILQKEGVISGWHDRKLMAGDEWDGGIKEELNTADIILLLVSADFIASKYCYDIEVTRAMERHEAREAYVIPVILRPVRWKKAPFSKLIAFPKDAKAVTEWENKDSAFVDIAAGIEAAAEKLIAERRERLQKIGITGIEGWSGCKFVV
jgi:TIR domain